jgi:hypothetical protein
MRSHLVNIQCSTEIEQKHVKYTEKSNSTVMKCEVQLIELIV